MDREDNDAITIRQDLPEIILPDEELRTIKKRASRYERLAKANPKPPKCRICGKETTDFCISHTIPRFCLKALTAEGMLLRTSTLFESNIFKDEVGLKEAITFKQICKKCDTEFFKQYETPEVLLEGVSASILGQIASKSLLREIEKNSYEIGLYEELEKVAPVSLRSLINIREREI